MQRLVLGMSHALAAAIARVHPMGVDVASGVERSRGIKDAAKMEAFVRSVREAR